MSLLEPTSKMSLLEPTSKTRRLQKIIKFRYKARMKNPTVRSFYRILAD
jgi:hypothetical protein